MHDDHYIERMTDKPEKSTAGWQIILKDFQNVAPNSHIWSEDTYRIFGYSPFDPTPSLDLFFSHIHPEDLADVQKAIEQSIRNCSGLDVKFRITAKDGEELLIRSTAHCEYYFGSRQWVKFAGTIQLLEKTEFNSSKSQFLGQVLSSRLLAGEAPIAIENVLTREERSELENTYYPDLVSRLQQAQWHLNESQKIAHIGSWQIIMNDKGDVVPGSFQWSEQMFRLYGYTPDEVPLTLDFFVSHIHPDDRDRVLDVINTAVRECSDYEIEFRTIKKDKTEIILLGKGHCSRYLGSDKWVKIVGTGQDTTAQKKAARYEASLHSIFDHTALAYVLLDSDMNIVLFNKAAYNGTLAAQGLRLEEGRSILHYASEERKPLIRSRCESALLGEKHDYEISFELHGETRWYRSNLFPVRCMGGNMITGLALAMEDITDRKKADDIIRCRQEKYRTLFEHSTDAILITINDGDFIDANAAACAMFQMTREELCRLNRRDITDKTDPNPERFVHERKKKGFAKGELQLIRKDGTRFPAFLTSAAYIDEMDREHSCTIIRDRSLHDASGQIVHQERHSMVAHHIEQDVVKPLCHLRQCITNREGECNITEQHSKELLNGINEAIISARAIANTLLG
jgi:PAS domain S-box-containing protein